MPLPHSKTTSARDGLISAYRHCLPLPDDAAPVSLCEGATPLIRLRNIPAALSVPLEIHVKYEGLNPTGSFKDRGMTVAVTQAVAAGSRALICASTGNTSASAAAYGARAGLAVFVLIPDGKIAMGKLAQAIIEGAAVVQIRGNFDQGMELVKTLSAEMPVTLVNSVNPYRLQGQKTAAFEIVEALDDAPDYHCLPVGNAGNISAYWMGYSEAARLPSGCVDKARQALGEAWRGYDGARAGRRPRMLGYQAAGAAPIVSGRKVENPDTIATAIRIGNPQSWDMALIAGQESGGWFDCCTDEEILAAQRMLAEREGIFCEPASAISIAGLLKDVEAGKIEAGSRIVCTLTGHGLKDPDAAMRQAQGKIRTVPAELEAVREVIAGAQ